MYLRLLSLSLLAFLSLPARAAQSYDNCTGFIDSLPTSISTQGVWCLRKNLTTAINNADAIAVVGNNITIDCNEFKIGGLAAGPSTQAIGIGSNGSQNITVRNCGIRGFSRGIELTGGAGHLVEDNRLDNNIYIGIAVTGDYSMVRRNRIFDMGSALSTGSYSLIVKGDAIDNVIAGASGSSSNYIGNGLVSLGTGGVLRGNRISGMQNAGSSGAVGIWIMEGYGMRIEDNHLVDTVAGDTIGISAGSGDVCVGNSTLGYAVAKYGCTLGSGEVTTP
jgi:hypothetical protein